MSFVNKTRGDVVRESAHKNFMGGNSWDIQDPLLRLEIAAKSCFFGEPMYYHTDKSDDRPKRVGVGGSIVHRPFHETLSKTLGSIEGTDWRDHTPAQRIESAIDAALAKDVEKTLELAARLRNEEHFRTTPQVIMVRAANHKAAKGTGLISKYAERIMRRLDEPAVQLAYQLSTYGKDAPIPNALKKAWRKMLEGATEYGLAKYRMENRVVKLVDVVNLVHPKSAIVDKLVKGELSNDERTWEAIISKEGSSKEAWTKALDVMGHMATLRNLRNLHEKGVDPSLYVSKLVEGAKDGQQFPFRYYSAYQAVKQVGGTGKVLDAIEEALNASVGNLPAFSGRVMSLCDNSGSAQGTATSSLGSVKISTIGNLTGVLTGMRADDGHLGVFGDQLETFAVRPKGSVFEQLEKAEGLAKGIGDGTENGIWLFFDRAIKKKEHWDHVFIYSDQQAGHGGLYGTEECARVYAREYAWPLDPHKKYIDVAKLVSKYRATVNSKVMVYLVQIAGYQDVIVPEFYDRTFILGGWSDSLLRFAASMNKLYETKGPTQ